jgi:hypothetical protein
MGPNAFQMASERPPRRRANQNLASGVVPPSAKGYESKFGQEFRLPTHFITRAQAKGDAGARNNSFGLAISTKDACSTSTSNEELKAFSFS